MVCIRCGKPIENTREVKNPRVAWSWKYCPSCLVIRSEECKEIEIIQASELETGFALFDALILALGTGVLGVVLMSIVGLAHGTLAHAIVNALTIGSR